VSRRPAAVRPSRPETARIDSWISVSAAIEEECRSQGFSSPLPAADDYQLREQAIRLVAEGLQQLEHASLVRFQLHTSMGYLDWAATRRGRAALERGEVLSLLQG
jgi:hypothetical protein